MPYIIRTPSLTIQAEPLTQANFAQFGTVISNPITSQNGTTTQLPANAVYANQGSAIKVLDVTNMTNYYDEAPSRKLGKAVMNMFVCSPRVLRRGGRQQVQSTTMPTSTPTTPTAGETQTQFFDVQILERHPFTSQTFIPLGLDKNDPEACYLVIVAPTMPSPSSTTTTSSPSPSPPQTPQDFLDRARSSLSHLSSALTSPLSPSTHPTSPPSPTTSPLPRENAPLPNLPHLRAFIARGNQAVTYAAGTWHAPMVVLGRKAVGFVVVQFANGVGEEDCQEVVVEVEDGLGVGEVAVEVDLGGVDGVGGGGGGGGVDADVRAKL